jgi:hypothetical protein
MGKLLQYALAVSLYIREGALLECRHAVRYAFAAIALCFLDLTDTVKSRERAILTGSGLMFPFELDLLEQYHEDDRPNIVLHWSGILLIEGHNKCKKEKAPSNVLKLPVLVLCEIENIKQTIHDDLVCRLPFQYYHLVCLMLVVNKLFWAYYMAITHSIFSPLVFFYNHTHL